MFCDLGNTIRARGGADDNVLARTKKQERKYRQSYYSNLRKRNTRKNVSQ